MHRYVIAGEHVTDVPSLCCAFERAVGAADGGWGSGLQCFDDRLFGGYGMEHPCEVIWERSDISRRALDGQALAEWAAACLAAEDYLGDSGREWLEQARADGRAGLRTLFDEIIAMIESARWRRTARR
ncbi:hypothetical protein [Nannocystis sp. SCPEA4]|uniref:hypothetical protein n=1 Tax=Nannocystis sp. SCPEA4 TaxID=2996787 RepID=UPI00227030C2|nr:hypothetical protein [Nannocystis sp. SCPEA4]MCY1062178.1 hypothetical protein [Nannocystis sp. SCPEA4]